MQISGGFQTRGNWNGNSCHKVQKCFQKLTYWLSCALDGNLAGKCTPSKSFMAYNIAVMAYVD